MIEGEYVVCFIPARGGSKGIPRKNVRLLNGRPLIAHTIDVARTTTCIDRVIVTTDDEEIGACARDCGAEVPFLRPAELAQDSTPPFPVLKHAFDFVKEQGTRPDIVVWLEPTFPFRSPDEVTEAVALFRADPSADSMRSVIEPSQNPFKMWKEDGKYITPLLVQEGVPMHDRPRQESARVLWQNGHLFLLRARTVEVHGNFYGERILPFVMARDRSIDIDTEADWAQAELMSKRWPTNKG